MSAQLLRLLSSHTSTILTQHSTRFEGGLLEGWIEFMMDRWTGSLTNFFKQNKVENMFNHAMFNHFISGTWRAFMAVAASRCIFPHRAVVASKVVSIRTSSCFTWWLKGSAGKHRTVTLAVLVRDVGAVIEDLYFHKIILHETQSGLK